MIILTHQDFSRLTDRSFSGAIEGRSFTLVLDEVRTFDQVRLPDGAREAFSLLFRSGAALPQGTYPLVNEELGPQDIFLVPVARDEAGLVYEAVFN